MTALRTCAFCSQLNTTVVWVDTTPFSTSYATGLATTSDVSTLSCVDHINQVCSRFPCFLSLISVQGCFSVFSRTVLPGRVDVSEGMLYWQAQVAFDLARELGYYLFSRQSLILSGNFTENGQYPLHQTTPVMREELRLLLAWLGCIQHDSRFASF